MGAVGLPGTVSFISSIAPIAIAMGVPVAPLGVLLAVEQLPDIFRTLGNVAMDISVTRAVSVRSGDAAQATSEADELLREE
jgi:Na+/H+-dicarboxylate symporter